MPDLAPPPTSAFPSDPTELERTELEAIYLQLRRNYRSLMLSRGQHRGRATRQSEQIREQGLQQWQQSEELRTVLAREAKLKAEAYATLEAVTEVIEHLEDAGDALSRSFGAFQLSKRRPGALASAPGLVGGGPGMPQLMKGVLQFLNRWRLGKEGFTRLMSRREALQAVLEAEGGRDH